MMGRYIPPALRNKAGSSECPASDANVTVDERTAAPTDGRNEQARSLESLSQLQLSNENSQDGPILYTLKEIHEYFRPAKIPFPDACSPSTLNNSFSNAKNLAYVMLFPGANPRWDCDKIVFAKSNLKLLPGFGEQAEAENAKIESAEEIENFKTGSVRPESPDTIKSDYAQPGSGNGSKQGDASKEAPAPKAKSNKALGPTTLMGTPTSPLSAPIAVFSQDHRSLRSFRFQGYFRIIKLDYLSPHSPELIRMQEQKWEQTIQMSNPADTTKEPSFSTFANDSQEQGQNRQGDVKATSAPDDVVNNDTEDPVGTAAMDEAAGVPESSDRNPAVSNQVTTKQGEDTLQSHGPNGQPRRKKERTAEAWAESLRRYWAVIQFTRDEDATKESGEPAIERHPEDDKEESSQRGRRGGFWGRGGSERWRGGERGRGFRSRGAGMGQRGSRRFMQGGDAGRAMDARDRLGDSGDGAGRGNGEIDGGPDGGATVSGSQGGGSLSGAEGDGGVSLKGC